MRSAFGVDFDVPGTYLNTPAIGIPPVPAVDAVRAAVERWGAGLSEPADFDAPVAAARGAFADLVGVPDRRVCLGSTVSQLISLAAVGVDDGARVLACAEDFTSITFPFAAQNLRGVTVTEAEPAQLPDLVAEHDLVATSVVRACDGALADLDGLREAAAESGVPVLLDATQSLGWLSADLSWADWVVAAGYKWLLAPRGAAWMAVHPRALHRTRAVAANWFAGEDPWDTTSGLPLRLADGARGFDLSPVWLAQVAAAETLPWLADLDVRDVHAHCAGLADELRVRLGRAPTGSAIVAVDDVDPRRLAEAGVRASVRNGRVRVGFHLYNAAEDVDRLCAQLT
jgi:selenocysteine lyase/cysteine desulfurase